MNLKNTMLALSMLMGVQALGMDQAPRPDMSQNFATLNGLPADVKGCVLQHLATADITETEREILVLAATNKQLINNPHIMIAILNAVAQKVTYTAHAIELAQRLQKKEKTLPMMKHESICKWVAEKKDRLKQVSDYKHASFRLAIANYGFFTIPEIARDANASIQGGPWLKKVLESLDDKNLDINTQDGLKKTILMECIDKGHGSGLIKLLLSLGVNIDIPDYRGKTCLQVATEKGQDSVVTLLQKAQKIRKQKLALKQK